MNSEEPIFRTLTPRDPKFESYLLGSFSEKERALPQTSLNVQSMNELVTFEIKKLEDLESAPMWKKLWLLFKPQTWLTVLVPLIAVGHLQENPSVGLGLTLAMVLVALMVFANWQADLVDHLGGWDRLQGSNDKNVLRKGWFTGYQLKKWSRYALVLATLLGLPLLRVIPFVLVPYALVVVGILLLLPRWWRKSLWPGLSSLCICLLSGPLLTVGIDLAFDGYSSWSSFFLGVAWGVWMSFVRQQKIYTKQWDLYQRSVPVSFLGLGFDRSKAIMRLLIPTVPFIMVFSSLFVVGGAAWFFPLLVVHIGFIYWELQLNEGVQSSIGSSLQNLQYVFTLHHYVVALVMILGAIVWKTAI